MTPCKVTEVVAWQWSVDFPDGRSVYLSTDSDCLAFAENCGVVDGQYDPRWMALDPESITQCPDEYLEVAQ